MVKGRGLAVVIGLGLLGACTRWVDDPLAVHDVYGGLSPNPVYRGPLPQVLWSAPETPDKQGLLYTSMFESEVAAQYAGRAAVDNEPSLARSALGEVVYAIDPAEAPPWGGKSAGIVSGWAGAGYGVRRATGEMAADIRSSPAGASEPGQQAAACADNTLRRANEILALSDQALDPAAGQPAQLQQIHDLALELHQGSGEGVDSATCGLQQAKRDLDRLAGRPQGG